MRGFAQRLSEAISKMGHRIDHPLGRGHVQCYVLYRDHAGLPCWHKVRRDKKCCVSHSL